MTRHGQVRIGTSGWIYGHWRGVFYPPQLPVREWFAYYSRAFDTVEINNTFYRLPAAEVFDGWRQQAPPRFVYAVKASRFLTHRKKLNNPAEPLQNILERADHLGAHLGPILYQLPPHWRCNVERLRQFIVLLPPRVRHVFEFRDPSWYNDTVQTLLRDTGMGFCIHDYRGQPCPLWTTAPFVYVRFHGPTAVAYAGSYRRSQLQHWAEQIRSFQQSGRDVYAYFNNDGGGSAVANARQLQTLLGLAAPAEQQRASPGRRTRVTSS